jgi:hypothetical protein
MQHFMAHGWCFLWNPELLTLHVMSDASIAVAYFIIGISLIIAYRRTPKQVTTMIPRWAFRSFATFIIACACTHIFEIVVIFDPLYFDQGIVKLITAVASVSTAVIVLSLAREGFTVVRTGRRHDDEPASTP